MVMIMAKSLINEQNYHLEMIWDFHQKLYYNVMIVHNHVKLTIILRMRNALLNTLIMLGGEFNTNCLYFLIRVTSNIHMGYEYPGLLLMSWP